MKNLYVPFLFALAAAPLTAHAGPWDWDEEFSSRHWRAATLYWAHDIHPDHPSIADLQEYYDPPAEEMWCHYEEEPMPLDFEIHSYLLFHWLHEYLEIPLEDPLPPNLPGFPPECFEE